MPATTELLDFLRLTLTPGVGPVLCRRLLDKFNRPERILAASVAELESVEGIGAARAQQFVRGFAASMPAAEQELALAERLGVQIIALDAPNYPSLLREISDAPPVLYVRGEINTDDPSYTVAIVGSRKATPYGIELAERFGAALADAGLCIVSGGARGVDSATHRGVLRVNGRTLAVLGCGLSQCYPPENAGLFDEIVAAGGAIVSELPLRTNPAPENFPARNRIISGLSLGVLVIEAPMASGALITARAAAEDHGREVMAIPGRIDAVSSAGCNDLIKRGEAALITSPADVLAHLESPARHLHAGHHAARYASPQQEQRPAGPALTQTQQQIVAALVEPRNIDELCQATQLDAGVLLAEATMLELRGVVRREGSKLALRSH